MPNHHSFPQRHLGTLPQNAEEMLSTLGYASLDAIIDDAIPSAIRSERVLDLPAALNEVQALARLKEIMGKNKTYRSLIGLGYANCMTPPVIQRNILENPGWYTAYTPYQAEISQGRMEALLNFQTMITDLTGLDVANASLLDEGTAAAEAMHLSHAHVRGGKTFFVSERCHPHTLDVVMTRAEPLGIKVVVGDHETFSFEEHENVFGVLVQYPCTYGTLVNYEPFFSKAKEHGALSIVATDLLALCLLKPPAEFGADIAVGNSQRFGVPLGYGGPHAAFIAVTDSLKRKLPGRLVGISHDAHGRPGYRLSLQTREQHIRRDKATSNICTAQVLLAVMASMYAVYHGPKRLKEIAETVHQLAALLARRLKALGFELESDQFFDTLTIRTDGKTKVFINAAEAKNYNLRYIDENRLAIALDETVTLDDLVNLLAAFGSDVDAETLDAEFGSRSVDSSLKRTSSYLTHAVFNSYHTETEMMRYLRRLEGKDVALNFSMISLGSCTMKLNAAAEMMPLSWPEVNSIHPFAPLEQTEGYQQMCRELEHWLAEITGFAAVSLQPNAGSQGEYAGLLAIRRYHHQQGEGNRNSCLIPTSAHGTNPASAVMAGFQVVPIACDAEGNIDVLDLKEKAEKYADTLGALMITYPSTHGVFEDSIIQICEIIHEHGGQVYMDGANMNAQVGLTSPGEIGADVCHLNLHKTFCIPHGGGGPGVGPIGVAKHLVPYLPGHALLPDKEGAVCSAPWGSASICTISWMYIAMMGTKGLTEATKIAILNANYMAKRLEDVYPILYRGNKGLVAHECIVDVRPFKESADVSVEDIAKRLIDYGFHAPTMSWPVAGTLMIEPTESEFKDELDRFCEAMIAIHQEICAIESGEMDREENVLKNAPHTAADLLTDNWSKPYSREQAAYPAPWLKENKYWPPVSRIDNVYGDRNLVCTCPSVEEMAAVQAPNTK